MAQQYSFDPSNEKDRSDAIKILKALDPRSFNSTDNTKSPAKNDTYSASSDLLAQVTANKAKAEQLEREKKKLEDQLKTKNDEVDRIKKELVEAKQQCNDFEKQNQELQNRINEIDQEYDKLIKDADARHIQALEDRDDKYRKLQRDSLNNERRLQNEIDSIRKRLEAYEPIGAEVGEERLFTFNETSSSPELTETYDVNAPFKVRFLKDRRVKFQFNTETGLTADACKKREEVLLPFCDIIEGGEDAEANDIRPDQWGEAKLSSSDTIQVKDIIKKARIKLIKK